MNKSYDQAGGELPPQAENLDDAISLEDFLKLPLSSKLLENREILEPGYPESRSRPPLYPLPSLDIVVNSQHNRRLEESRQRTFDGCL
jgi:hypothetical protein